MQNLSRRSPSVLTDGRYHRSFEASIAAPPDIAGLDLSLRHPGAVVRAGAPVELSSVAPPILVQTGSVDEYKSWIGVADADLDPSSFALRAEQVPSGPWSSRPVADLGDLTDAEQEDVRRAGSLYLFGYSPWVESYRGVFELCHAPFRAAVYAVHHLRIAAGAQVTIFGDPAMLIVDDLIIEEGGRLVIHTVCRAWIDRLTKLGSA